MQAFEHSLSPENATMIGLAPASLSGNMQPSPVSIEHLPTLRLRRGRHLRSHVSMANSSCNVVHKLTIPLTTSLVTI